MKCLWITRQDPRPADSGELLYSLGLMRSLAAAGADITALCHAREGTLVPLERTETGSGRGAIHWKFVSPKLRFRPLSLFSPLPSDAFRLASTEMRVRLRELLDQHRWDYAIVDHAAMAWALDEIGKSTSILRPPPSIIYISHNNESETRGRVAKQFRGGLSMRFLLGHDARKYRALERRLCMHADLISAITSSDEKSYRAFAPEKPVICLTPGYNGDRKFLRTIENNSQRTVLFLGSFQWFAKRMNLKKFVAAAEPLFKENNIRLQIVGKADHAFVRSVVESRDWCRFASNVNSVTPFLEKARIGVIAEESGGGFKLKALDYLFHHLPIAALEDNLLDLDLAPGTDFIGAQNMEELAGKIAKQIDDVGRLNAMKDSAYAKLSLTFDWADRGERLLEAMEEANYDSITTSRKPVAQT